MIWVDTYCRNVCSCMFWWFPLCPVCWWQYRMAHDIANLPQPWMIYIYVNGYESTSNKPMWAIDMTMIHVSQWYCYTLDNIIKRLLQTLEKNKPQLFSQQLTMFHSKVQLRVKCEEAWVFSEGLAMNWAPVPTLKLFWPIPCHKTENHAANSLEQPAIRAKNYELVFIIYKNVAAIIPGIPQVICGWISSRYCTRFQHSFLIRHRILQENCQHAIMISRIQNAWNRCFWV